jgi:hypothetical protein
MKDKNKNKPSLNAYIYMYLFICGSVGKMIFHIFQISEMHFVFTCAMTKNIGTVATHGHSTSIIKNTLFRTIRPRVHARCLHA